MITSYIGYRGQLFLYEIKHWLSQLSGMALCLVCLLGPAIPVLFYLALLGLGMLLEQEMEVSQALLFMVCLLLFQTVILDLCKDAIKGLRFQQFTDSLTVKSWLVRSCDCFLATVFNPMVLLNVLVISSVSTAYWSQIDHMMLFLVLQILVSVAIFLSPLKTYLLITLTFLLSLVQIAASVEIALLAILMLGVVLFLIPFPKLALQFNHYPAWFFWLDFWWANIRMPMLVLTVSVISLLIAFGFVQQRPDLANTIFLVAGQFLVLLVSGLQVELNKLMQNNLAFFKLYQEVAGFCVVKDLVLAIAGLFVFVLFSYVSSSMLSGAMHFIILMCCFLVARQRPTYLLLTWLLSCVFVVLLQYVN